MSRVCPTAIFTTSSACASAGAEPPSRQPVGDEGQIWREFLAILETVEKPVLIHYGSYETAYLERMRERHGGPTEGSAAANAIEAAVNAISILFAQISFPTLANGLKDIADFLGFK